MKKKKYMKYFGQCLEHFFNHTNMPNFHLSSLDGNTTPKQSISIFVYFELKNKLKENNSGLKKIGL